MARHAGDFEQLGVERIFGDGAFGGHGFAHEARRMDDPMALLRGEAGGDELAAAGEAEQARCCSMKPESNVQVGIEETLVDEDGCAASCGAERAMFGEGAGVVIDHAIAGGNVRAEDGVDLRGRRGAVQAGGDEDGDAVRGDSCGVQALEQWGQREPIGGGARDVTDGDGGGAFAGGEFDERPGADGMIQRVVEGGREIGEWAGGARFEEMIVAALGQRDGQAGFAEGECRLHVGFTPRTLPQRPSELIIEEGTGHIAREQQRCCCPVEFVGRLDEFFDASVFAPGNFCSSSFVNDDGAGYADGD